MLLTLTPIVLPFDLGETVYLDEPYHDLNNKFYDGMQMEVTAIHPQIEPYRLGRDDQHFVKDNQLNLFVREITYRLMPVEGELRGSIDYRYLILENYQNKLKPLEGANADRLQLVMSPIEAPFNIGDTAYAYSQPIWDALKIKSYKGTITSMHLSSLWNTNFINEYNINNQKGGQYNLAIASVYYRVDPDPEYKVWKEEYEFIFYPGSFGKGKALFSSEEELNQYISGSN